MLLSYVTHVDYPNTPIPLSPSKRKMTMNHNLPANTLVANTEHSSKQQHIGQQQP